MNHSEERRYLKEGTYVLAHAWGDASPYDPWCIGWVSGIRMPVVLEPRQKPSHYEVTYQQDGRTQTGLFRFVRRISKKRGELIVQNKRVIEFFKINLISCADTPLKLLRVRFESCRLCRAFAD